MVVAATEQYFNTMRQNYRIQTDEEKRAGKENKRQSHAMRMSIKRQQVSFSYFCCPSCTDTVLSRRLSSNWLSCPLISLVVLILALVTVQISRHPFCAIVVLHTHF